MRKSAPAKTYTPLAIVLRGDAIDVAEMADGFVSGDKLIATRGTTGNVHWTLFGTAYQQELSDAQIQAL